MVSIIVPVYKVERFLSRCIDSLINQSYRDIEIILVDDGSPDACPQICDQYSFKDDRVRVIHKVNGGLSSSRNAGLEIVNGSYVCFVDSDDWISLDSIEHSMRLVSMYNADVVETGIFCTSSFISQIPVHEKIGVLRGKEILQDYMLSTTKGAGYSVCKCLFSIDSIRDFRFREGYNNEDIDFKYRVLSNCNTMVKSNRIQYFYFQGENSITTGGFRLKDYDLDIASDILVNLTKDETYGTIAYLARVKRARCAFSHLCKLAFYGCADDNLDINSIIKHLTLEHRGYLPLLLRSPIPFSRKMLAISFAFSFKVTRFFIKIFR